MQTVILDATTKTLKGVLASAITTTQPDYVIAWADSTSTTFTEGSSNGAFNSTSDVTMVAAPAASTRRVIKSITVYNRDTASITFTLKFDDNGTQRFLTKQTLASGASWSSDGGGNISGDSGGSNSIANGRLTLTSSVPVTTSDVTGATTLYYTPYNGNSIALYDGTSTWTVRTFSQLSLDISNTTNYKPNTNYDIFAYWTGSAVALESAEWTANTGYTITAITTGASPVLTYTGASSVFAVGDIACVQGCTGATGQNGIWAVTAVTSTTVTLAYVNSSGTYTANSGTIRKLNNARTSHSISRVNGVLCKDGATTRRYLGTIFITEVGGATEDSITRRFVWNYNNRVERKLANSESANSWTVARIADFIWLPANSKAVNRVQFICGVAEDMIRVDVCGCFGDTANTFVLSSISVDRVDYNSVWDQYKGKMYLAVNASSGNILPMYASYEDTFLGYHFLTWIEYASTSNLTSYGRDASTNKLRQIGMGGYLLG